VNNESVSTISLFTLITICWKRRFLISAVIIVITLCAGLVSILQTPIYRASALLAPVTQEQNVGGMNSFANNIGALSNFSMVLGGPNIEIETVLATLNSRLFLSTFISDNAIDLVILNEDGSPEAESGEPSSNQDIQAAYAEFARILNVSRNINTGLVEISMDWSNPQQAANWVNQLVRTLNTYIRASDINEARESIEYLNDELEKNSVIELRQVLFNLVEIQTRTQMLANVREEYALKVIDPAVVPLHPVSPNRRVIVFSGLIFGLLFGALIAIIVELRAN